MRRPGVQLTHEVLVEEARFILRTLLRDDLFGKRVRLTEAERVLDSSISLTFADYCGFLNKYGYVRVDQLANVIEVTEGGTVIASAGDDPEFQARLSRHFARELGTAQVKRPTGSSTGQIPVAEVAAASVRPRPPEGTSPPQAGEDVLDRRYRRGAQIGSGPIGLVHEGEHIPLGRPIAIKEARAIFQFGSYLKRDEIVRRLKGAVQAHARLLHPGIIQVLDQNHEREFPYFVMELAGGGNLRGRMSAAPEGKMPLPIVVRILTQMAYALRHAHQNGVVHLGLKPENVLFDSFGNVKLSDFGFGRIMDRDDDADRSTSPVLVGSGTVGYLAPERIQPDAAKDAAGPQADIYSLGMLCYEMLTGKLPGRRSPLPSAARPEVPAAFDDVFDRMTRDELSERYSSIDEVLAGVYKAFTAKDVFAEGTILMWAADPNGPSAPKDVAAPALETPSEATTGEVEVAPVASDNGRRGHPAPAPARAKG